MTMETGGPENRLVSRRQGEVVAEWSPGLLDPLHWCRCA